MPTVAAVAQPAFQSVARVTQARTSAWIWSIVLGSLVQLSLFALLPWLTPSKPSPESTPTLVVDFVTVQTPQKSKTKSEKPPVNVKPTPKPKPIAKSKPKAPTPPPKPQPSINADAPEPVKPLEPIEKPQPPENAAPQPTPPQPALESPTPPPELPTPVPEFEITEYPRYAHEDQGRYPFSMRALGREAVVGLDILIDKDGVVRNITVSHSQGDAFDQAAIEKIRRSSFLPGKSDGKPVTVLLHEKVTFTLQ